jgi:hypothetical protein
MAANPIVIRAIESELAKCKRRVNRLYKQSTATAIPATTYRQYQALLQAAKDMVTFWTTVMEAASDESKN